MTVRIVEVGPQHLTAVARFSERTWQRPRTADFCRWRYLEAPSHRAFMALRGEECLAMLSVFTRPYRMAERSLDCLETADWYCLPELRLSGLGVRLMQRVMDEPHPIVAVGGSVDTLRLLPRLGWQQVGETTEFRLELGGRLGRLVAAIRARLGRPGRRLRPRLKPRRGQGPATPPGGRATPVPRVDEEVLALYAGQLDCASVPLPRPAWLAWMSDGQRATRRVVPIHFRRGSQGRLAGWSLLRLDEQGGREGLLLEVFAPVGERELYPWMVAETVAVAAASGAMRIKAQTSCPSLRTALLQNGFVEQAPWPIHFWPARCEVRPQQPHFGLSNGDAPLLPYPCRWSSVGQEGEP